MAAQAHPQDATIDEMHFIPGTVHLVDLEGTLRAKHASGQQRDIVLVPGRSLMLEDTIRSDLVSSISRSG